MLAHFSEDPSLMHLFHTSKDIFTDILQMWLKISPNLTLLTRDTVKKICYSVIYGISAPTLALEMNIEPTVIKQMMDTFWSSFPNIGLWKSKVIEDTSQNGYVCTLCGRKRYLTVSSESKNSNTHENMQAQRQAVNTICQASAADLIKQVMINVYNLLQFYTDIHLICQIHDELLFEIPKDEFDKIIPLIHRSMIHSIELKVPLEVKIKYGPNWNDLSDYQIK